MPAAGIMVVLLVCFLFWGMRPLWEPDEGRYVATAREMLLTGDWLTPRLHGQTHLTKPPLTYWMTASGMWIFGMNAWGARFFLSAAFFLASVSTIGIARTWGLTNRQSFISGLVFSTSLFPFVCGHVLTTDMFLLAWETTGVLCAWRTWGGKGRTCLWRTGFWMAFGMAFLTKGPPGWLPLLVILLYGIIMKSRGRGRAEAGLWSWYGFIMMLIISLGWFAVLCLKNNELFGYFLFEEVRDRFFSEQHERVQPYYFYPLLLIFGLMPWLFIWPMLVARTLKYLGPALLRDGNQAKLFTLIWFLLPLVVFQLSRSKSYFYITPLFVPISLWCGYLLGQPDGFFQRLVSRRSRVLTTSSVLWAIVLVCITVFPDGIKHTRSVRGLAVNLEQNMLEQQIHLDRIYTIRKPAHSLAIYSGIPLRRLRLNIGEIFRRMQEDLADGSVTGLLVKTSRMKERDVPPGVHFRVLAADETYQVLVVDLENTGE